MDAFSHLVMSPRNLIVEHRQTALKTALVSRLAFPTQGGDGVDGIGRTTRTTGTLAVHHLLRFWVVVSTVSEAWHADQ